MAPGSTRASFEISSVSASHIGNYDVVVTNPAGPVTSATATLNFIDWNVAAVTYQGSLVREDAVNPAQDLLPGGSGRAAP